jgi:hypothetical protein
VPPPGKAQRLLCSARGCRHDAQWALRWNNPKLHEPARRKTWLACADHREPLSDFLSLRGFLRDTEQAGGDAPEAAG